MYIFSTGPAARENKFVPPANFKGFAPSGAEEFLIEFKSKRSLRPASEAGRCLAKLGLPAKQAGRLLRHRRVARELLPRLGCEARGPGRREIPRLSLSSF